MAILSIFAYLIMVYFFQLIKLNSWDNLVFFIGYVPLRGVGYNLMPNFPVFILIIVLAVDLYYLHRLNTKTNTFQN